MDLLLTRLGLRIGVLSADPADFPYTSKQCISMFKKAGFKNVHRSCVVLFTGDPWFLPPLILHIIGLIEGRLQGGRWVMVIGEKGSIDICKLFEVNIFNYTDRLLYDLSPYKIYIIDFPKIVYKVRHD
jgi:hypothetical protein